MTIQAFTHDMQLTKLLASPERCGLLDEKFPLCQGWMPVVFQHSTKRPDAQDKWCAVELQAMFETGEVAACRVSVGEAPRPDVEVDANNAILAAAPEPFSGQFIPDGDEFMGCVSDGLFSWSDPVLMTTASTEVEVKPGKAWLEVGAMPSIKLVLILLRSKQLFARWPYGSDEVFVFAPKRFWA